MDLCVTQRHTIARGPWSYYIPNVRKQCLWHGGVTLLCLLPSQEWPQRLWQLGNSISGTQTKRGQAGGEVRHIHLYF